MLQKGASGQLRRHAGGRGVRCVQTLRLLMRRVLGREASGEGEGFEASGGGVARIVAHAQPRTHAQGPDFVETAVQDAEGRVVGTGIGDHYFVMRLRRIAQIKYAMNWQLRLSPQSEKSCRTQFITVASYTSITPINSATIETDPADSGPNTNGSKRISVLSGDNSTRK